MDAAEPTLPKTVKMSGKDTSKHPLPEETRGSVPSLLRCLESLQQDGTGGGVGGNFRFNDAAPKKCHNMLEAKFVNLR